MLILITNIVVLNGGDGAILFGMIKSLRAAYGQDVEIVVYASEPSAAKRMYPEVVFRETLGLAATQAPSIRYWGRIIRLLRSSIYLGCAWGHRRGFGWLTRLLLGAERGRDFDTYARADLVVSSGGTYLKEEYGVASQVCDYRITLLLGRLLTFYTQTLGPFTQKSTRTQLAPIFNAARAVLLRDERSRQNLLEIGVKSDALCVSPDAAFALANPEVLTTAPQHRLPTGRSLRIAISVRRWAHFKGMTPEEGMGHYLDFMVELTRWVVNDLKAEVVFLSTCQGNSEYDDDASIATSIVARLEPEVNPQVSVVTGFVRFDTLLQQIPQFDLVLATRMHMAILSLMAGTPAIPLALEFKTNELYTGLGLGEWVVNVEAFDQATARRKISDFLSKVDGLREELFSRVVQKHSIALQGGMELKNFLSRHSTSHAAT